MTYPSFFDAARIITMQDPLAGLLGAADQGIIRYTYADVVKLAGHSCPTVAGAYLMTLKALEKLYGEALPQRGEIKVEFRDAQQNGVTGVIANVASYITGATTDYGFKGLGGQYDRRNLLFFNVPMDGEIRYTRTDTGASTTVDYHPEMVSSVPTVRSLLPKVVGGYASDDDKRDFADGWQDRVRRILEQADDPRLVTAS